MRSERRLRRLVLPDAAVWGWTVRHRHRDGGLCQEVLTLYRDRTPVRIVFPGTGGAYGHSGLVADRHGNAVNLHEPGVVRAFVDAVRRREATGGEVDGWALLPGVVVSLAAAATPGAPPGCPPGP
ncbi:hypothetical protein [Streptomyces sp. NPDC004232]|uniref:hypothetical protein n=1 Tax=unclassified Streptomyces TaxID=2593676 RepID=UPI001D5D9B01|nr:hypothetical protein [Streptomyces sp. tea 10]